MTVPPAPAPCSLTQLTFAELKALLKEWGEPPFRAVQLGEFLFAKGLASYDEATNLPRPLRARLRAAAPLYDLRLLRTAEGGDAVKWLWQARDGPPEGASHGAGALIESVQIRVPGRSTACLSCQVGCPMGCVFCATGLSGFERNLRAHEMVEQYLQMQARSRERASHVVFMGMGEPLLNYEEVLAAVRRLHAAPPEGCGVSARRITLSTVGLPAGIRRLAREALPLELAISLHAPDDRTRRQLIPAAQGHSISEIMSAAREYARRTHRLVTYEYVLLAGVNDAPEQAQALAGLLKDHPCKVNLIPFNPVPEVPYRRPSREGQQRFQRLLAEAGIPVTIRNSKGRSVSAACGQLRRQERIPGST